MTIPISASVVCGLLTVGSHCSNNRQQLSGLYLAYLEMPEIKPAIICMESRHFITELQPPEQTKDTLL